MHQRDNPHTIRTRGIPWVLCQSAILLICLAATMHAWHFVELVVAAEQLDGIAEAALREALFPDTNRTRIERVAIRRLQRDGICTHGRAIQIEHNHRPAKEQFHAQVGDCFSVSIMVPASAMLPVPLARWSSLFGPEQLHVRAERTID